MRNFNPRELNHLLKYNIDPFSIDDKSIPVEYITGFAEFRDFEFIVDSNVLIPRIESEDIINFALEHLNSLRAIRNNKRKVVFADIGTGSGSLGITLALELKKNSKKFKAFLADISDEALEIAKKNIRKHKLNPKNFVLINSDLLEDFRPIKFDLILANLPYIPSKRIDNLDDSVKKYEPNLALDGGKNGLEFIKRILLEAQNYLRKDGLMVLEVDDSHGENVLRNHGMNKYVRGWDIEIRDDINYKNRFWLVRQKK